MIISDVDFQRFAEGNEKSFETIFYQYYRTLVSYAMRHGLEIMDAENVVLDTFHYVWQIREKIKSAAALHSMLFVSTRHLALNITRNLRKRQKILSENYQPQEIINDDTQDYLIEEEMTRLLNEAISKLPRQCEQIMVGLLAGNTLQEIAKEMQISINTAKTYKLRAIQALRELLKTTSYLLLFFLMRKNRKNKLKKYNILSPN